MGASYTRQSTITNGLVADALLWNAEYDALQAAFATSTGHTHDGTGGEGGPIAASSISLDSSSLVITASTVQAAVAELDALVDAPVAGTDVSIDPSSLLISATNAQTAIAELDAGSVPDWDISKAYVRGDLIKISVALEIDNAGDIYKLIVTTSTGDNPLTETSKWAPLAVSDADIISTVSLGTVPIGIFSPSSGSFTTLAVSGTSSLGLTNIGVNKNLNLNGTGSLNMGTGAFTSSAGGDVNLDGGNVNLTSASDLHMGTFSLTGASGGVRFNGGSEGFMQQSTVSSSPHALQAFYNPNGQQGGITINATSTSFVTSSDPRLKTTFVPINGDLALTYIKEAHENKWSGVYEFLSDPGVPVAGYNAHAMIDNQPGYGGTEGIGSREDAIGTLVSEATYKQHVDKAGDSVFKETFETRTRESVDEAGETVVESYEHLTSREPVMVVDSPEVRVTPAGMDASKRVPLLEAAIHRLLERVETLESQLSEMNALLPG